MDTAAASRDSMLTDQGAGWRRLLLRYGFHLLAAYLTLTFVTDSLAESMLYILSIFQPSLRGESPTQFVITNLLLISSLPALLAGFFTNARLRHRSACFVWIVPAIAFAYSFAFHTPGIYPTMPFDGEFRPALHHWFGGGFNVASREVYVHDVYRIYHQIEFIAPLYAGIAYAFGAWLAIRLGLPKLDAFLAKW
jgi:hypothetical protein